jgi:hypothetical protein
MRPTVNAEQSFSRNFALFTRNLPPAYIVIVAEQEDETQVR